MYRHVWPGIDLAFRLAPGELVYDAIVHPQADPSRIRFSYEGADRVIAEAGGVHDGDIVIFVNFRADRARELTMAFVNQPFDGFARKKINLGDFVCMTEYTAGLPVSVAFPPSTLPRLFGEELAAAASRRET